MTFNIGVESLGPVSVAARAFSRRETTFLTAIVKASFTLRQDGPMEVTKPRALVTADERRDDTALSSVRRPSDLAPFVQRPELVVDAIAFASAPGTTHLSTRLAVARGTSMLISKHLDVVGDRRIAPKTPPGEPQTFESMPIVYERAFGGALLQGNPCGTGAVAEPDGLLRLPNVIAGAGATAEPPGYGAISSVWPARKALRGRGDVHLGAAFLTLPSDFEDAYFQCAPPDQQVAQWRAGDLIVMANLHPTFHTLRVELPPVRAVAIAETRRNRRTPIVMRPDLIFIEPHMMRAEIVFRGAVPITADELDGIRVAGSIDEPGRQAEWPDRLRHSGDRGATANPEATIEMDSGGSSQEGPSTLVLETDVGARGDGTSQTSGTLVLEAETTDTAPPTPGATVELTVEPAPRSMPFPRRSALANDEIAGAAPPSWSELKESSGATPADRQSSSTLVIEVEAPLAAPLPPAQAIAPTPAGHKAVEAPPAREAPWREDPAVPERPPAPPPRTPDPKTDVRGSLYKKFKW